MPELPLCVLCRQRAVDPGFTPFCSLRCRMADLGRWLSGTYRVAGPDPGHRDPDDPSADDPV